MTSVAPRKNFQHLDHRLADALEVVGEWWTPLIVSTVNDGSYRFESIQNSLGIARNILTDRLNTLVAGGVLEKRLYSAKPRRYEYHLTARGLELIPIFERLEQWGDRHAQR
ncbi:MAG: transcriptional regulator [Ilumatobacteraceae bacterium]|nr:transcriptional regulator [Ilumatobacteraceae bacterium]